MPLIGLFSGLVFAEARFACAEINRPNFLKNFNLRENGPKLLRTLLEDQIEGLRDRESCTARRSALLATIAQQFTPADLKDPNLQVLLGRLRLLEGRGDMGAEHFRTALSLQPFHIDALFYAAQRANKKGERERERVLLQGLLKADFKNHPESRELFEQSFERLTVLMPASEARMVIDGPWKEIGASSLRRARRGLEIAHQSKDAKKMQEYFAAAFGPGDIGAAPSWALRLRGRYHILKGEMNLALESFDRSLKGGDVIAVSEFRDIDPWLELANANSSHRYLRSWSERVLRQTWRRDLSAEQQAKVERFYVRSLQAGAIDAAAPMRDMDVAQKLVPTAPELLLLATEVLLSRRPPLKPEGAFRDPKVAAAKARVNLRYLQSNPIYALDAGFWELWMDAQAQQWQQVRGRADIIFAAFQRGDVFTREASLKEFWIICRDLYTRTRAQKDYSARLKLVANNPQAKESVRQSAQSELQNPLP